MIEDQIIVSDSGNNRIVVLRTTGHVEVRVYIDKQLFISKNLT